MARTLQIAKFTADGTEARREFDRTGDAGERMGDRVKRGAEKMSPALRGVDAAAGVARQKVDGMANSAGSAGTVLRAMGPIGLAAAAGIGAAAVAFSSLQSAARDAVRVIGDIDGAAKQLGVSTDFVQEFRYAVIATGGDISAADGALLSLSRNLGQLNTELGKRAKGALEELGFSAEEIANMENVEEALPRIIERIGDLDSAAAQMAVAQKLGLESVLETLQEGEAGFERLQEQATAAGYVLDRELITRAAELDDEWRLASQTLDLQLKASLVDLAPIFVDIAGAIADASRELREFLDNFKEVERRGRESVNTELRRNGAVAANLLDRFGVEGLQNGDAENGRRMASSFAFVASNGNAASVIDQRRAADLYAYLAQRGDELRGRLAQIEQTGSQIPGAGGGGGGGGGGRTAPTDPEIARLRAFVEQLEEEVATREQLAALASQYPSAARDELQARAALADTMEQLEEARAQGVISSDEELARLQALAQGNFNAAQAEAAHAEAIQRRTAMQQRVDQFAQSVETPLEALRRQEAELYELRRQAAAEGIGISDEAFARGLERINDAYREMAAQQYEASLAGQVLQGIFDGQIKSLEDIEMILVRMASDAVLRELLTGSGVLSGEGGFAGFLSRVGDRFANSITGGEGGLGGLFGSGDGDGEAAAAATNALADAATNAATSLADSLAPSVADAASQVVVSATSTAVESKARDVSSGSLAVLAKSASAAATALAKIVAAAEGDEAAGFVSSIVSSLAGGDGGKGGGKAGGGMAQLFKRHEFAEGGRAELLLLGGQAEVFPADTVDGLRALSRLARVGASAGGQAASGPIAIRLVNESGVALEAAQGEAEIGPDGAASVVVMLRRTVEKEMADGNLDNVMGARFGAKRRRTKR